MTGQSSSAFASAMIRMWANLRHISCDAITHTQSGLSANIAAAAPQASDEWQQSTNPNAAGDARCAGDQSGCKLTFVLLDVVRFTPEYSLSGSFVGKFRIFAASNIRCSIAKSDSTMQRTSDLFAKVERYFCGNSVCGSKSSSSSRGATSERTDVVLRYSI
jgi:hypothetical protein